MTRPVSSVGNGQQEWIHLQNHSPNSVSPPSANFNQNSTSADVFHPPSSLSLSQVSTPIHEILNACELGVSLPQCSPQQDSHQQSYPSQNSLPFRTHRPFTHSQPHRTGPHPRRATVSLASPNINQLRYLPSELYPARSPPLPVCRSPTDPHSDVDAAQSILAAWGAAQALGQTLFSSLPPQAERNWSSQTSPALAKSNPECFTDGQGSMFFPPAGLGCESRADQPLLSPASGEMLSLGSSLFEKTAEIENPSPFSCTAASSAISAQSPHTAQNFSTSNSSNYSHYPVSIPNSNSVASFDWPNPFSNASGVIDDGCSANYSQALPMTYNHMVNTQITSSMADIQGAIGSSDQVLKFAQSDPQSLDFLMHQNYIPEQLDSQPLRETSLKARGATVDFTPNYRATHSNINRYSWDEAAGRISNASISSSINEPRRESDPLPVAPIPQRPWNSKYSCSNESLSCNTKQFATLGVPALNRIGAPPDGSISGNPLSSNQNDSFSANPTCKTSAVLDMNSVLSLEDEKLEYNAESSLNPRYHSLLRFQNGENSKEGAPLVSGRDFSSVTTGRSANIPDVENINLNNKCESTQETNNNNNNYMGFPLSSSHFEPCHQTVSQEQQIDPSHLEFFNLGRTIPLYTHTAPHRSISPYAPPGHVPSAPEFHDLSNHRSMGVPVSTSASCTHRLPELSMEVSQQQQPIRLRRLTMMTRPLYSETRQIQECVTASEEPKEGSILKIISPQNNFHSYSERKRKVNSADRQLMEDFLLEEPNAPLYGESEKYNQSGSTESFSSSEVKTPTDETPDEEKTGRSQYEPMRFGGIGQGKSPFPPGLDGKLRPSSEDFEEAVDEDGESVVPWKQELRCDEDLYTPIWCRGQNDKKEGFCDMCDGGAWFRLKNSAYWYHKQYFHGVSSTTGHYFYPPKEIKRGLSTANRQQILGLCHECEEWVGYSSVIGNQQCKKKPKTDGKGESGIRKGSEDNADDVMLSKVSTLWYKHAHKCHRHQTCKGAKGRKKAKKSLERVDGVLSNKKFRFQS